MRLTTIEKEKKVLTHLYSLKSVKNFHWVYWEFYDVMSLHDYWEVVKWLEKSWFIERKGTNSNVYRAI